MKHFINKTKVTHKLVQKNVTDFTIFIGTDKECLEYRKFNYIIQENFIILPLSEEKNTHKVISRKEKNLTFYIGSERECFQFMFDTERTLKDHIVIELKESKINYINVVSVTREHVENIRKILGCDINQLETYTDAVKDIFVIVVNFDFYKKRILKLNNDKTLIFEMKNYFNKNMKPNTARMFAQVIIINYKQL